VKHIGDELADIVKPFDPVPIPTKYQGVEFRSRLEARWAVFLTNAKIRWEYEFEGFKLPTAMYVPDFWLPELKTWLEIKPVEPVPSSREMLLCEELCAATGSRVLLAFGSPALVDMAIGSMYCWGIGDDGEVYFDTHYAFCECSECGALGVEFEGRGDRVCRDCTEGDRGHTAYLERFQRAVMEAKCARFW